MEEKDTTGDVIDQPQEDQATEQTTTDSVTVEEKKPEERDDYWKNRAHELDRKLGNLTNEIPVIIEKTLKEKETNTQNREYSVSELEAYAIEHPEHRPWVEEQKEKVRDKKWEEKLKKQQEELQLVQIRQQTEAQILNDSRYAEAFVNEGGRKVFNPDSKLAHLMSGYYNTPELKNRPDGLAIAAKLARADIMDESVQKKEKDLTSLKRQNTQLKQQTMVEGGGVKDPIPSKDSFQKAADRLRQTGRRKDAEVAVKEYFKKIRS